MSYVSAVNFVKGAIAKKDIDAALCHIDIKDGRATAYGGRITLSTPIDCGFNVRPHARTFFRAVYTTLDSEEVELAMTGAGRLRVKQHKFKAFIDCLDQEHEMARVSPEGPTYDVPEELYNSIKVLAPYMSIDASRPWAQGLKISANSTFATNNVVLIERWHGSNIPIECIIPQDCIAALLKSGQVPIKIQYNEGISITFHFENERWLCSHLVAIDGGWNRAEQIFEHNTATEGLESIDPELFDAVDSLKDLLVERRLVYLKGDRVCTSPNDEEGAEIEHPVANGPIFHAEHLTSLRDLATKINFSTYPKPCYFVGDKLRGIIVGVRA